MSALRSESRAADVAALGLAGLFFFLGSTSIGYQDLGALIVQEPKAPVRFREHAIASPFGTIHQVTFSLPQPVGTDIPEVPKFRFANVDPAEDIVGSIDGRPVMGRVQSPAPVVNRAHKGDRLAPTVAPTPEAEPAAEPAPDAAAPETIPAQ
jgi:hypothetical protein